MGENKKKKLVVEELARKGYDSDPVKAWKKSQQAHPDEEEENEDDAEVETTGKGPDFDYILGMPMWNLTQEKKDLLCKNRDERNQELKKLKATTPEQMWRRDLKEFLTKLDEVEAKERAEANADAAEAAKMKGKIKGGKKGVKMETLPSAHAIRIDPIIADELKIKASKAVAAKERKEKGEAKKRKNVDDDEVDEFDVMTNENSAKKSLAKRIGDTPENKLKKMRTA